MKTHPQNHRHTQEAVNEWLGQIQSMGYAPQSIRAFRQVMNRFLSFLSAEDITSFRDVTAGHVRTYRSRLTDAGLSESTVFQYLRIVRMFFARLEDTGVIFVSPASGLVLPKPACGSGPVPSESDIRRLMEQPDTSDPAGLRDRAVLEIFYSTGIRLGELTGMNTDDPDFGNRSIRIRGKGGSGRIVPLGRTAVCMTEQYLSEVRPVSVRKNPGEPALFTGVKGRRIHPRITENLVRSYGKKAGLHITPHTLRRACATHMLANGAHPSAIQKLLGHASSKSLGRYLRLTRKDMADMHGKSRPGE